jgi:hypothetical protein
VRIVERCRLAPVAAAPLRLHTREVTGPIPVTPITEASQAGDTVRCGAQCATFLPSVRKADAGARSLELRPVKSFTMPDRRKLWIRWKGA